MGGPEGIGKLLVMIGLSMVLLGAAFWGAGKLGLGSLPGDLRFGSEQWGCYVPLATSIVISVLLTLILNLLLRWFNR